MTEMEPPFSRPKRTGLHRDLVDALGKQIVTGGIDVGTVLPIEPGELVGLTISRSVTREALKVLAAKGLIESRPKVGTRVLGRPHWSLLDPDVLAWSLEAADATTRYDEIYEIRAIIEPRIASLAAERRSDVEAVRLGELLDRMRAGATNYDAYVAADLGLHTAVLAAAHNVLLAQMVDIIRMVLDACQRVSGRDPALRDRAIEEHRAIVTAITDRDPAAAARSAELLLVSAARDLRGILASEGGSRPGLDAVATTTAALPATTFDTQRNP